jgi:DNA-binding CsgD family transcriptional regulator
VEWDRLEALRAIAIAALLEHQPARAADALRAVSEHTVREHVDEPGVFPFAPDLVEALAELGALAEAAAVTERLGRLAAAQQHPWALAASRRCTAVIELASGPYDERQAAQIEGAAADLGALGLAFDHARTLLGLGRARRRARKWGAARRTLEQAASLFDELGSPGWADQARAELARIGARKPQQIGELTPTEQRVAELAAQGLSNKEIAQALFVTVNTVEAHLSHAYAKLGIRSRAQLARAFAEHR